MTDQNKSQDGQKDDKKIMDQVALLSYVDDLIKERKDPDVKPENMADVRGLLLKEVNNAINVHLIGLISEKDQVELDELLDKNVPDDELNQFFIKKIPNLEVEIASALLNFRAAYLYPLSDVPDKLPVAPLEDKSKEEFVPDLPPPAPVTFKKTD